ncbi:Gfo/Idh/MocA family oxidoreductase [Maribacter algarum]|uniref:Gfo/Idh/MocA family oxidoreductase n=1 Tax=Maribacter algarum (ex Zhang et al. 2020) TaxID=2578118 RepID=A0A5S3PRE0_9FLAO|nr:Gfo/Idh/MocA family oxidoreductase [Maribacter algarum]TMM57316.1 Gfo/Idh/MocA family oxidoreductase [Maribacter algarum]
MKRKIKADKVRWGILGVGDVCEVKSAPAMQKIANSDVVAVMRRSGEKAKDYAERHGVGTWYDNADELINDPNVNAIYIATPPNAHKDLAIKAAKSGKPIYVEKPMARTTVECQEMIDVCKQANVPLYIAYYRRKLPNFEKLKSFLDDNAIGDIRMVNVQMFKTLDPDIVANITSSMQTNWRIDPNVSGGGYFFDLAAHQLDYLDYVLGPVKSVAGFAGNQARKYHAADIISSSFVFQNGIIGSGSWCFTVDDVSEKDQMTFIGSKGQITISFFGEPKIFLEKSGYPLETFEFELPYHIQQPLIQTIVDDLLGYGICPSTGDSAIRTNWVMEQMTKNYYAK